MKTLCKQCRVVFERKPRKDRKAKYCSMPCFRKHKRCKLVCQNCRVTLDRSISTWYQISKLRCSKECLRDEPVTPLEMYQDEDDRIYMLLYRQHKYNNRKPTGGSHA